MKIPNVGRALVNLAGVRLRRAERHWRSAARALDRLSRQAQRQGEIVMRAPELARVRAQQGRAALVRSRNRLERFDDHVVTPYRIERRVKRELAAAAASGRPILVGPWTSEVGYEALYWIPFLHWAADRYGVTPDRLAAVSRGGTGAWYTGIANRYVEIFDLVEPADFAREAAARRDRGDQKQMGSSDFDRQLIAMASERLGLRDPAVWHPGLMYQLFRAFWYGDRSLDFLLRHADFRRLRRALEPVSRGEAEEARRQLGLPAEYAAVKFYTGQALPDTPRTRDTLYRSVEQLASRMPVVMLDMAWSVDEHQDYAFDTIPGVTTLRTSLEPRRNLGVQTQVLAGARLFLGTCGGLAWLAPLLGVETLAVYEDDRYLTAHLYASRYAYRYTHAARFSTVNLQALRALHAPALS